MEPSSYNVILSFLKTREKTAMDIGSGRGYPADALSNFAPHPFVFRGVSCNSMEGLLQSFKFSNPEMQKFVCTLVGRAAKFKGKKKNWYRDQTLYWDGKPIRRDSPEYQQMLDEAFRNLYTQNQSARNALLATGDAVLEHSIGKRNENETVLTRSEFTSRLTRLRDELKGTPRLSAENLGIKEFLGEFGKEMGKSRIEEDKKRLLDNNVDYKRSILLSYRKYHGFDKAVKDFGIDALKHAVTVLRNHGYTVDLEKGIIEKRT